MWSSLTPLAGWREFDAEERCREDVREDLLRCRMQGNERTADIIRPVVETRISSNGIRFHHGTLLD
jgi:hypothetical protein